MARWLYLTTWVSTLLSKACGQVYTPYEPLPTEPLRDRPENGTFTFPAGSTEQFTEGTPMTIRWNTNFEGINLYVIYNQSQGGGVQAQRQLATGASFNSLDWTVSCDPDCNAQYTFRAVDAFGDEASQLGLGFWSRRIWIRPKASSKASTTSTQSSSVFSPEILNTDVPHTTQAATSLLTTPPSLATEVPSTATLAESTASDDARSNQDPPSSINGTAIGVGAGVGAGVVLLALASFLLWRHRKRKAAIRKSPPLVDLDTSLAAASIAKDSKNCGHYQQSPAEAPGWHKNSKNYGHYHQSPVEAPGWQPEPQELPARQF